MERRRERLGRWCTCVQAASMIDLVDVAGKLGARGGAPAGVEGRNVGHYACASILSMNGAPGASGAFRHRTGGAGGDQLRRGRRRIVAVLQDPDGNTIELKGPASRMAGVGRAGDRGRMRRPPARAPAASRCRHPARRTRRQQSAFALQCVLGRLGHTTMLMRRLISSAGSACRTAPTTTGRRRAIPCPRACHRPPAHGARRWRARR